MRIFKFTLLLLGLGVVIVLGVQNPQPISVNFLKWSSPPVAMIILVLACLLVGLLCGFFLGWTSSPRRKEPPQVPEDEPPV